VAQQKARQNILDLIQLIKWNHQHQIHCLRISSDLFPHFTDDQTEPYTIDFARPLLKKVGDLINRYQQRIIMHPGQFNQVGSPHAHVYAKTVADLSHHVDILNAMDIDQNGVIIVHIGGTYQSKKQTIKRWIEQFHMLPDPVKQRLVIENCERNYSIADCLQISHMCGGQIPVVFDFHHYACWKGPQAPISEMMGEILETWQRTNKQVVMHLSEQNPTKKLGAHSDYIEHIPDEIFEAIIKYKINIDLEIEAKMKEQAILKLYRKYHLLPRIKITVL
jgi:UV DNA damage endonuclease